MRTLHTTLKEIALLDKQYTLVVEGYRWQAAGLLRWLERNFPAELSQPVKVVFPTMASDGGIYLLDKEGEVIGSLPLYWIEHPALKDQAQGSFQRPERPMSSAAS